MVKRYASDHYAFDVYINYNFCGISNKLFARSLVMI